MENLKLNFYGMEKALLECRGKLVVKRGLKVHFEPVKSTIIQSMEGHQSPGIMLEKREEGRHWLEIHGSGQ